MNKLRKALALILSLAAILCFPISASALSVEALLTIDYARTGSVDIYSHDPDIGRERRRLEQLISFNRRSSEAGVESNLGNTQIVNQLTETAKLNGYAIKGVEPSYLKIADICTYTDVDNNMSNTQVFYGIEYNDTTDKAPLSKIGPTIDDR